MAISNVFEKLGRAIFETPFGANRISKDAPELAEIRLTILDAVKARSHRASGAYVFPYNLVRIELLGVPDEQAAMFRSEFLADYFADELKTSLRRSNYRFPRDLKVEIITTPKLPGPDQNWLSVQTGILESKHAEPISVAHRHAKLVVTSGTANHPEILLEKTRTNIGRTAEVYRGAGPSRRNDLAFLDDSDVNRSVSREHAHVLYSKHTGEYRLVNDRVYKGEANCGIWIVRDGLSQPVHRSARGVLLKDGDEIHLGTAILRFEMV